MTKVKFKMFKGDVIALFVNDLYNENLYGDTIIMSYQHIGQHGAASSSLKKCRNATPQLYNSLLAELERIGYNDLIIV